MKKGIRFAWLLAVIIICASSHFIALATTHNCASRLQPIQSPFLSKTGNLTLSTVASADSYVSNKTGEEGTTHGEEASLLIGNRSAEFLESYLLFTLEGRPSNFNKAEISLYFYHYDDPLNISVSLVTETWDELELNWTNRPRRGPVVGELEVDSPGIYALAVTDYVQVGNNASFCLNATSPGQTEYARAYSREGYGDYGIWAPSLVWTYEASLTISVTRPSEGDELEDGYHLITWTSVGASSYVSIDLYEGSDHEGTIASRTENDGEFTWRIYSHDDYDGDDYAITVTDYSDSEIGGTSGRFSITLPGDNEDEGTDTFGIVFWIGIALLVGGIAFVAVVKLVASRRSDDGLFPSDKRRSRRESRSSPIG